MGSGSWENVRRAAYDYYGVGSSFGSEGDLQRVRVQVPSGSSWSDINTTVYRYYLEGDSNGFKHGLKYVVEPLTYARMVGAGIDPMTTADSVLATYADANYEYDWQRRVVLQRVEGGTETSSFSYTPGFSSASYNVWANRTVETLPDNSQNIVYTNRLGQYLLKATRAGTSGSQWMEVFQYDAAARPVQHAHPSAVVSYDDTQSNLGIVLASNAGLIETTDYYSSSGSGAAPGYVQNRKIQQGTSGTPILLEEYQYTSVAEGLATVYSVARHRTYRNDNGTGTIDTTFAYTYHIGTTQIQQQTTTLPIVTTAQNGPNIAATQVDVHDSYGRLIWSKDEQGFLTYREYGLGTGSLVKLIIDVDTSVTGEFTDLPMGWVTPTGGGLNLITRYEVDGIGRTVKTTSPNSRVDYTVYKDMDHEVRYYPGWNATTNRPTGPTQVNRLQQVACEPSQRRSTTNVAKFIVL